MASDAQAIRFTVIAHASPRYRSAKSPEQADSKNLKLSQDRESSVRAAIVKLLQTKLGTSVSIRGGTSYPDGTTPVGVEVGGDSVGSRDSLRSTGGDRNNDDAIYRKVDVIFEKYEDQTYSGNVSTGQTSARIRKWWRLRVDRLDVHYRLGFAVGDAELTLQNGLSEKSMQAKLKLDGGGYDVSVSPSLNLPKAIFNVFRNIIKGSKDHYTEREFHSFECNQEMGFEDFNDKVVIIKKNTYKAGLKGHTMSIAFDKLGTEASMLLTPVGGIGGLGVGEYTVLGQLQMVGKNPGDWIDEEGVATNDVTVKSGFTHTLTFENKASRYDELPVTARAPFETLVENYASLYKP